MVGDGKGTWPADTKTSRKIDVRVAHRPEPLVGNEPFQVYWRSVNAHAKSGDEASCQAWLSFDQNHRPPHVRHR